MSKWESILLQTGFMAFWILLNLVRRVPHWDPYPFPLLGSILLIESFCIACFFLFQLYEKKKKQQGREDFPLRLPEKEY